MAETKIIKPYKGFQEKFVRSNIDVVIGGGVLGAGKAQPLDSLVCTPFGFRRMGDLNVGDIISNSSGGMQRVIHIYERGKLETIEFEFADGRKVNSALDHLWKVRRVARTPKRVSIHNDKSLAWEIMTTEQIVKIMDNQKGGRVNVPMCEPVQFTRGNRTQGLTIHPYVLGCLLGDGCITNSSRNAPFITTTDDEIVERISSLGYDIRQKKYDPINYAIHNPDIKKHLKQKKLLGTNSATKFIPSVYKYATIEDRIELIKGLFDTDGCAIGGTIIEYDTVSEQLANDVRWIIHSLGGYCTINTKIGSYKNQDGDKVICKKVYRLYINIGIAKELFHLTRKRDKLSGEHRNGFCNELQIVSYKRLEPEEMRCIRVSNPDSLYITDGFIVTHNTSAAVMMCAEPSLDPNWRAVFLRNNLGDLKSGGGILDEFKSMYRGGVNVVESGDPKVIFPSGARIDVTHIADQSRDVVRQRFKGRQYDLIYFDEMTGFEWDCFVEVCTRNRGTGKWTGKIRGTTNPDRDHWLRTFLDWYIGVDGFIREDRNGVVRYFYIAGETVKDVVWGDTKEEVYRKCKIDIDRKLARINGQTGTATYKDMIRSFTFYLGRMSENQALVGGNSGYVGAVAMSGGRNAEQLLEGNWNISPNDDLNAPIPSDVARNVVMVDEARNGDYWLTADMADEGDDNFTCLIWDGFHIVDTLVLGKTKPKDNVEAMLMMANRYQIATSHIIYDATRARYVNDYIPDAIPYISAASPRGMYKYEASRLKDECYLRLVQMINRGFLSMSEDVAQKVYQHNVMKQHITFLNEFLEECAVVRFNKVKNGRQSLLSKKEMNRMLGKGRSMDVLDPMAMRMLPILEYAYGEEYEKSTNMLRRSGYDFDDSDDSIYDDNFWC